MRVIVTRPELSARRTARRLEELGHTAALLPLSRPVHDPLAAEQGLRKPHCALAVTSAEAIRALQLLGSALEPHLYTTMFSVGRATSNAAQEAGFHTVITSGGNGADLARRIDTHFKEFGTPAEPLLYIGGNPRTPLFEKSLAELYIASLTVGGYRMAEVEYGETYLSSQLDDLPVDAVLFYSRETAERFFRLPVFADGWQALEDSVFLCLSANVAAAVPAQLRKSAVVATIPEEEGLLDLL